MYLRSSYINFNCKIFLSAWQTFVAICDLGLFVATCFARGISAKVQSLWDLIESQSTALVVRKQEHCLVILQVFSSNARGAMSTGSPHRFVICYVRQVNAFFWAVFSFGLSLQKLRHDLVCYAFHWRAYQELSCVSCATQIFTSLYIYISEIVCGLFVC